MIAYGLYNMVFLGGNWAYVQRYTTVKSPANARKVGFLFSALYAAFVFGGRHLMNKRAKYELRKPLVLWSLTLAVFR